MKFLGDENRRGSPVGSPPDTSHRATSSPISLLLFAIACAAACLAGVTLCRSPITDRRVHGDDAPLAWWAAFPKP